MKFMQRSARAVQRGFVSVKVGASTALLTLLALGMTAPVFAGGGGTSPGAAIAAGLTDGPSEMGLVFAGVAVLIGLLLVWSYIRRSAK